MKPACERTEWTFSICFMTLQKSIAPLLEIRTREHLPEGWAQIHNNLVKAALSLEDRPTVAESHRNVLTLYPDYTEAYQIANAVYHEKLFADTSAFKLSKQLVVRHPTDLPAQANFAGGSRRVRGRPESRAGRL